ncbi:MAG: hypothetical protein JJT89_05795 [Nitriliruptoraceae bacterium]|nr:hypothetical protein [Nitriliruptoraceae bacterium]
MTAPSTPDLRAIDGCAELARSLGERPAGTGPVARGWILIEVPGPWGRDALTESGLDPAVGAELARRTDDLDVKVLLIRAPGRHARDTGLERRVLLAHAGTEPWLASRTVPDDDALLTIDPRQTLRSAPPADAVPLEHPVLLVCTHARRDACCARIGRPAVEALALAEPSITFEVSHVGGHRFAGNLVVLPEGIAYGGLDAAATVRVAAAHLAGALDLDAMRGRSRFDRAGQAAEIAARRHLGVTGTAVDVEVAPATVADATHRVHLGERAVDVRVRRVATGEPRATSCDAAEPSDPGHFETEVRER